MGAPETNGERVRTGYAGMCVGLALIAPVVQQAGVAVVLDLLFVKVDGAVQQLLRRRFGRWWRALAHDTAALNTVGRSAGALGVTAARGERTRQQGR